MGKINNRNLNINQKQVIISGILGDGCLWKSAGCTNYKIIYSCIFKEYLQYKSNLLVDLSVGKIYNKKQGKKSFPGGKGLIYVFETKAHSHITQLGLLSLEDKLQELNELGLALWFYDDGSLHKDKLFYNLNTQAFSLEDNTIISQFLLKKFNIIAKITIENKKDGRFFYYLRISKYEGAIIISKILEKYRIECLSYKIWSLENIQKWDKFEEILKEKISDISSARLGKLWQHLKY